MTLPLLETWVSSHGLPMVITLVVIFFLFKYFMKQLDKPKVTCKDSLNKDLVDIKNKIDKAHKEITECKQSLSGLRGFLSGILFRNSGADND